MSSTNSNTSALMPTYNRYPVAFEYGEGSWLIDTEGKRYLDAISGIAVCALGHSHPGFTTTLSKQLSKLVHTSNVYGIPLQEQLAARLCEASGMEQAFFCNSGTEANEAAIKLARMYGHNKGIENPVIIVMEGAFHGRTMGSLSATHSNKHQAGFAPLLPGFVRVPYDDPAGVAAAVQANANVVAVLLEPVQGESGVHVPNPGYLDALHAICGQHDLLLMLDEVQTGNGRTGRYFAFQHSKISPHVLTTAKGLGNGFPIGACLALGKAANVFQAGSHATTFGGSPLACAAGLAVNHALLGEDLIANAGVQGRRILEGLREALGDVPHVRDVRGLGLMIGVELDQPCADLVTVARNNGVLINVAAGNVVRLLPPLNLKAEEAERIIDVVSLCVREFQGEA